MSETPFQMSQPQPMASHRFIAYYMQANSKIDADKQMAQRQKQREAVNLYIQHRGELITEYFEVQDRKKKSFPILTKALEHCQNAGAQLVFYDIQSLIPYEAFSKPLVASTVNFVALDLPSVSQENLLAVATYARQRRESHRRRIVQGLQNTMAKLGNPNALREITKINKPKIENAILFALILGPIIEEYQQQGLSQRKMVEALNAEGYHAPEGGNWVLSQLQKVLERIKLNAIALELMYPLKEFSQQGLSDQGVLDLLIQAKVTAPTKGMWDIEDLKLVRERIDAFVEIMNFNDFISDIYPDIEQSLEAGESEAEIATLLNQRQITVPERVKWERDFADGSPIEGHIQWDERFVTLASHLAKSRQSVVAALQEETFAHAFNYLTEKVNTDPLFAGIIN